MTGSDPRPVARLTQTQFGEHRGTCAFCGETILVEDLIAHLNDEHGCAVDIEIWPDGAPVVIDTTLEPEDFDAD